MDAEPDPNEIDPVAFAEEFNARIKQTEPSSSEPGRIQDEEEFNEFTSAMLSDADPDLVRDAFPLYFKHDELVGKTSEFLNYPDPDEEEGPDMTLLEESIARSDSAPDPEPFSDEDIQEGAEYTQALFSDADPALVRDAFPSYSQYDGIADDFIASLGEPLTEEQRAATDALFGEDAKPDDEEEG